MKKTLAVLLAGILCAGMLAACGSSAPTSNQSNPAEAGTAAEAGAGEGRTFTVGFDAEYPPYGFKDEGSGDYTGFDLEMAEELCKRRGWTLVKQPIDWDSKDMELGSGAIDCIWNGMTFTGREEEYTWSDGSSALTALTDDPGDGSNDENLALAASFGNLEEIADYNSAFMQMNAGVYDAIAVDIGGAQYQLAANEGKYRLLEQPISTEQYAIASLKGNTELRDQVQETFNEMAADGTVLKIAQNYTDFNLPDMLIVGK